MGNKAYKVDITKRYEVKFVKAGIAHKVGDTAKVGFTAALSLYQKGLIEPTEDLLKVAEGCQCSAFTAKSTKKAGE